MKLNNTEKFILKGDVNTTSHLVGYADSFVENLLELTESKTVQEAFSKVKPVYEFSEGYATCVCGHEIYRQFFVENIENGDIYTIGSECIHKFYRAELTNSKEWEDFIDYIDATMKLQKKVIEVLKEPMKIYNLRKGKTFEWLKHAKLEHLVPNGFDNKNKPSLYVKLDNYIVIKELAKLFNIDANILENFKNQLSSENPSKSDRDSYKIWNWVKNDQNLEAIHLDIKAVLSDRDFYQNLNIKVNSELNYECIRYIKSDCLRYLASVIRKKLKN